MTIIVTTGTMPTISAESENVDLTTRGGAHSHAHDHHTDHNFRAAYVHVVTGALTAVLAISALAAGAYFSFDWLDPVAGLVGTCVIAVWSYGLIKSPAAVLLDSVAGRFRAALIRHGLSSTAIASPICIRGGSVRDISL